ncbi:hypothetical protein D9757_013211 [Collybiopsis confluens]|uniref:Uncharacterized protein n=1 Tax=Collybiopsis confluens TaxID=2823264 RepID=A0A8H5G1P6_9AGAR|nr:hypothetical protein D9757_013211 [Collybiopsis confluens]
MVAIETLGPAVTETTTSLSPALSSPTPSLTHNLNDSRSFHVQPVIILSAAGIGLVVSLAVLVFVYTRTKKSKAGGKVDISQTTWATNCDIDSKYSKFKPLMLLSDEKYDYIDPPIKPPSSLAPQPTRRPNRARQPSQTQSLVVQHTSVAPTLLLLPVPALTLSDIPALCDPPSSSRREISNWIDSDAMFGWNGGYSLARDDSRLFVSTAFMNLPPPSTTSPAMNEDLRKDSVLGKASECSEKISKSESTSPLAKAGTKSHNSTFTVDPKKTRRFGYVSPATNAFNPLLLRCVSGSTVGHASYSIADDTNQPESSSNLASKALMSRYSTTSAPSTISPKNNQMLRSTSSASTYGPPPSAPPSIPLPDTPPRSSSPLLKAIPKSPPQAKSKPSTQSSKPRPNTLSIPKSSSKAHLPRYSRSSAQNSHLRPKLPLSPLDPNARNQDENPHRVDATPFSSESPLRSKLQTQSQMKGATPVPSIFDLSVTHDLGPLEGGLRWGSMWYAFEKPLASGSPGEVKTVMKGSKGARVKVGTNLKKTVKSGEVVQGGKVVRGGRTVKGKFIASGKENLI